MLRISVLRQLLLYWSEDQYNNDLCIESYQIYRFKIDLLYCSYRASIYRSSLSVPNEIAIYRYPQELGTLASFKQTTLIR